MTLKNLIKLLEEANVMELDIAIEVTVECQEDNEIIMNHNTSIDNKIAYYKQAYNEDLTHKINKNVRVAGVSIGKYF